MLDSPVFPLKERPSNSNIFSFLLNVKLTYFFLSFCVVFDVNFNNSLYGDLDDDGVVNVIDVVILVNTVLNSENTPGWDLNSDGIINILDIVIIVNLILGD